MMIEAVVDEQGVLIAHLPPYLKGKKILLSVRPLLETESNVITILDVFTEADKLDIPRYTQTEILESLQMIKGQ
ncbi:hypothetical protein BegalDRAFT_3352 [Beggiatoa alba B18LD]|uniref:Uncharacterized protein n=1 Tax=Beggiatoa alba B18LD TaxID=395493 RepID=I3CKM7_9GAMM|nr:hypothetical protein [Beggiatoa alba]EIJ44170.1 hypothetical protein BegalDRAFT_3352 [Beggiatoa alba B18LD]